MWLSLVERYVRDVEAAGSNPVTPTPEDVRKNILFYFPEPTAETYRRDVWSVVGWLQAHGAAGSAHDAHPTAVAEAETQSEADA